MGAEEFLNIEEEHKREFSELLQYCLASGRIDQNLYQEYDVKRGLRDSSGKGVRTQPEAGSWKDPGRRTVIFPGI